MPTLFRLNTHYLRENNARIEVGRYANGRKALQIVGGDGIPFAKATVNAVDYSDPRLDAGTHVLIKDYGENAGLLDSLVANSVVRDTGERVRLSQWAEAALCEVWDDPAAWYCMKCGRVDNLAGHGKEYGCTDYRRGFDA